MKYAAEAFGTFVLMVGGVGAAVLAGDHIGYLGVSFAFGLALLAMVYAIGPISGCHINPAVTIGVLLSRRIGLRDAMGYMAAQIAGAIVGGGVVLLIAKGSETGYSATLGGLGANGFGLHSPGHYDMGSAFIAEVVLTTLFVFVILGATDQRAPVGFAGLAIGLALTLVHLVGIPITNTSVNPARSIGSALFVGGWALQQLWVFILAPLVGGALAAGIYSTLRRPERLITTREAEEALRSQRVER